MHKITQYFYLQKNTWTKTNEKHQKYRKQPLDEEAYESCGYETNWKEKINKLTWKKKLKKKKKNSTEIIENGNIFV